MQDLLDRTYQSEAFKMQNFMFFSYWVMMERALFHISILLILQLVMLVSAQSVMQYSIYENIIQRRHILAALSDSENHIFLKLIRLKCTILYIIHNLHQHTCFTCILKDGVESNVTPRYLNSSTICSSTTFEKTFELDFNAGSFENIQNVFLVFNKRFDQLSQY